MSRSKFGSPNPSEGNADSRFHVRQSYDAAWGDYENGPWKFITFYSQPVQGRDLGAQPFESYSSDAFTFSMARAQRDLFGWATLSGYYAYYTLDNAIR